VPTKRPRPIRACKKIFDIIDGHCSSPLMRALRFCILRFWKLALEQFAEHVRHFQPAHGTGVP
jgi:hypothetical protein